MSPLPQPHSLKAQNTGMPQMRRKSGLRTASASLQEQFLARIQDLVDDPLVVLPECPDGEPRAIARLRKGLEALGEGRTPLAARFDKHVLGAVAKARTIAAREAVPRLMDAKVAGQRRFYLQVGHVIPTCSLGVQNHDEPRVLLVAYASTVKRHKLHFFAGERLWCSGKVPNPPPAWIQGLAGDTSTTFSAVPSLDPGAGAKRPGDLGVAGWSCGHADRPRVRLTWREGPWLEACADCGKRIGGLHAKVRDGYLGPNVRQPVEVDVRLPDGSTHAPGREELAKYRAGLIAEGELSFSAAAAWRQSGGARWAVGDRTFASAEALADDLRPEPWERPVLARLLASGYVAADASVASVLQERRGALGDALRAHLDDGPAFLAAHAGMAPRDLVRAAHDEARRRATTSRLPRPAGLGPQGEWIDALARANLADGKAAALALLRKSMEAAPVPRSTRYAFLHAVGGALDLESRFTPDEKASAAALLGPAKQVLSTEAAAYVEALRHFLQVSGSGEDPQ